MDATVYYSLERIEGQLGALTKDLATLEGELVRRLERLDRELIRLRADQSLISPVRNLDMRPEAR